MGAVYSWLKNIVFFMIFLTIVSNLLGKSDFKKYVNVVTGLLLVLITMNPLLKLTSLDETFDYFFDSMSFHLQTTEVGNEMRAAEENQKKVILQSYKEQISKQIEDLLAKENLYLMDAKIVIEEDSTSEDYATVQQLEVQATYYVQEKEKPLDIGDVVVPKVKIDQITLTDTSDTSKEEKEGEEFLTPMEIHIKTMLSDFYNLKSDNINISIQGG